MAEPSADDSRRGVCLPGAGRDHPLGPRRFPTLERTFPLGYGRAPLDLTQDLPVVVDGTQVVGKQLRREAPVRSILGLARARRLTVTTRTGDTFGPADQGCGAFIDTWRQPSSTTW